MAQLPGGTDVLPEKAKQLIAQLKAEAKKYLEGERLQEKFSLKDKKDGKKAAAGDAEERGKDGEGAKE